jgi:hypothetical protein
VAGTRLNAAVLGVPEALPAHLGSKFPELSGIRLRRGGLLPRIGGWFLGASSVQAITLWRTVWLGLGVEASAELLLHELRHVHQFQTVPAFPLRYIAEFLRRGYRRNRFEVEARQFASERMRGVRREPQAEDV